MLLGLIAFYGLIKSLKSRQEIALFIWSGLLFLGGYLGLIASLYPYLLPPSVTFQEVAGEYGTLRFTL